MTCAPWGEVSISVMTDIDTSPQGAQVILVESSGERTLGVTPLERVRIPRGEVTLRVVRDGYEEMIETVKIGRKRVFDRS